MEKKVITIGGQTYVLRFEDFDENVDVDSFLKIDYSNLLGELVTFPAIVNRFGQLLAEAENQVSLAKLNLEVTEAKVKERLRNELTSENGKAPSVDAVNTAVLLDKAYQALRKSFIDKQKTRDYINSVFWSAKDKSSKLDKLSLTVQPGDFNSTSIEGKVNNVLIKRSRKLIED